MGLRVADQRCNGMWEGFHDRIRVGRVNQGQWDVGTWLCSYLRGGVSLWHLGEGKGGWSINFVSNII